MKLDVAVAEILSEASRERTAPWEQDQASGNSDAPLRPLGPRLRGDDNFHARYLPKYTAAAITTTIATTTIANAAPLLVRGTSPGETCGSIDGVIAA